jgi:hypothetical protein
MSHPSGSDGLGVGLLLDRVIGPVYWAPSNPTHRALDKHPFASSAL